RGRRGEDAPPGQGPLHVHGLTPQGHRSAPPGRRSGRPAPPAVRRAGTRRPTLAARRPDAGHALPQPSARSMVGVSSLFFGVLVRPGVGVLSEVALGVAAGVVAGTVIGVIGVIIGVASGVADAAIAALPSDSRRASRTVRRMNRQSGSYVLISGGTNCTL